MDTVGKSNTLSPCHYARIDLASGDGVFIGSCSVCGQDVLRINTRTGKEEWLDGKSPWTKETLREVTRSN